MDRLKRFFSYFPLTLRLQYYGLKAAWEYRVSFFTQIGAMAANDVLLLGIWILFFSRFNEINGWTFENTQVLFAFHILSFSVCMIFFGGVLQIARKIEEGKLDLFLAQPRSALWRLLIDGFPLDVIGDLLFGLAILLFVCFTQGWIYLVLIPVASLIGGIGLAMSATCLQLLGFWFKRFDRAAWNYFWALEAPGLYPQTAIIGGLRIFLLTVVPSVWIITLPYTFIDERSLLALMLIVGFDIAITLLAVFLFRSGLKNYESGNLVRVNN